MSQDEWRAVAAQIAQALDETDNQPRRQIEEIIQYCGLEFAQSILQETLTIEAEGGLMLPDQSRRRTPGGVYFYVARHKMPPDKAKRIFPGYFRKKEVRPKPSEPLRPVFDWNRRVEVLKPLLDDTGVLNTVKITLIGRPGRVDSSHKDLVITTMSHTSKSATLPKGVPTPPATPTIYTVYIAAKQWRKVEEAVSDPEDALIVEGTCAFDDQIGGMAVFAMNVTSKILEAKKRQQKDTTSKSPASATSTPNKAVSTKTPEADVPPAPLLTSLPTFPDATPEANQKLSELYASASLFRQKIAAIQAKPLTQQSGLEMTLETTEEC